MGSLELGSHAAFHPLSVKSQNKNSYDMTSRLLRLSEGINANGDECPKNKLKKKKPEGMA